MNFSKRSLKKELLDRVDIPFDDIRQNMEELEFINTHLGGHKITIAGIRNLLINSSMTKNREFIICEIGCGGGDNMLAIQNWCSKRNIRVRFIGIDINPYCTEVASTKLAGVNASFITSDYILAEFADDKPDVIFSSLFCHHFTNEELIRMLEWMSVKARHGFFINDLHRHRMAYYSIKVLTQAFSRSYLVKNDAPLSVLRGFTQNEWKRLLEAAGISRYAIQWKWAFRHLITVRSSISTLH
ncbi:MAG: methyltransferase domain-containing protein [Chitinophagaceae bacterium]